MTALLCRAEQAGLHGSLPALLQDALAQRDDTLKRLHIGTLEGIAQLRLDSQHPFDMVGSRRNSLLDDPYRHDSRRTSPVHHRLGAELRVGPISGSLRRALSCNATPSKPSVSDCSNVGSTVSVFGVRSHCSIRRNFSC